MHFLFINEIEFFLGKTENVETEGNILLKGMGGNS